MINLFKIKGQRREEAANAAGRAVKKQSPGELRLQKGLQFFIRFFLMLVVESNNNNNKAFSC
jgi:hypothetical protein